MNIREIAKLNGGRNANLVQSVILIQTPPPSGKAFIIFFGNKWVFKCIFGDWEYTAYKNVIEELEFFSFMDHLKFGLSVDYEYI